MADGVPDWEPEESSQASEWYYDGSASAPAEEEEPYPDEEWEEFDQDDKEMEIEEMVVSWYASQSIDAQTCSTADLEHIVDAVESEMTAYYTRVQAEQRGLSMPAGPSPYSGSSTIGTNIQERQARVLAAKQRSRCRACGQLGHWQRDPVCPRRGQSKGGGKKGSKSKTGGKPRGKEGKGKTKGKKGSDPKSRVVYFSLRCDEEEGSEATGYMALKGAGAGEPLDEHAQRALEAEVNRLLTLPREEIDR